MDAGADWAILADNRLRRLPAPTTPQRDEPFEFGFAEVDLFALVVGVEFVVGAVIGRRRVPFAVGARCVVPIRFLHAHGLAVPDFGVTEVRQPPKAERCGGVREEDGSHDEADQLCFAELFVRPPPPRAPKCECSHNHPDGWIGPHDGPEVRPLAVLDNVAVREQDEDDAADRYLECVFLFFGVDISPRARKMLSLPESETSQISIPFCGERIVNDKSCP